MQDNDVVDRGWVGWGDAPDERDEGVRRFEEDLERLRLEEEAAKPQAQRDAEAEEYKAIVSGDLERAAEKFGYARTPDTAWKTASEHRADKENHLRVAARHWQLAAPSATTSRATRDALQQPRARQGAPRQPRRRGHGRPQKARAPGREDDSEPAAARCCDACGRDISHRRRDARTCDAACRQALSRAERAVDDADVAEMLSREAHALPLVRAGELNGLDALALVVWPTAELSAATRVAA